MVLAAFLCVISHYGIGLMNYGLDIRSLVSVSAFPLPLTPSSPNTHAKIFTVLC